MIKSHPMAAMSAAVLVSLLVAISATAQTSAAVFVPGNTLGRFGNPSVSGNQPYVIGIVATGPGTIVVTYVSGTVTDGSLNTGPNGAPWNMASGQTPLQEAVGVSGGVVGDLDALIGTFIPQSRVQAPGFSPVDGTKDIAPVGLVPSALFFIGTRKILKVRQAGTLYLGINDDNAVTNSGGYLVWITFTPAPSLPKIL